MVAGLPGQPLTKLKADYCYDWVCYDWVEGIDPLMGKEAWITGLLFSRPSLGNLLDKIIARFRKGFQSCRAASHGQFTGLYLGFNFRKSSL